MDTNPLVGEGSTQLVSPLRTAFPALKDTMERERSMKRDIERNWTVVEIATRHYAVGHRMFNPLAAFAAFRFLLVSVPRR